GGRREYYPEQECPEYRILTILPDHCFLSSTSIRLLLHQISKVYCSCSHHRTTRNFHHDLSIHRAHILPGVYWQSWVPRLFRKSRVNRMCYPLSSTSTRRTEHT